MPLLLKSLVSPFVKKLLTDEWWNKLVNQIDFTSLFNELKLKMVEEAKPAYIEFYKDGFSTAEFLRFLTAGQEKLMEWKATSQ